MTPPEIGLCYPASDDSSPPRIGAGNHHLRTGSTLKEWLDDFPSVSREQAVAFLALALNLVPHDGEPRRRGLTRATEG